MTGWWRIYYADGTTFSNAQGDPRDAPRVGVIAVAQEDAEVGYRIVHAHDYYYWEPAVDGWCCSDLLGAFDHLVRCREPLVLMGRMIATPAYRALLRRMREELGEKQGWKQEETRRGT